MIARSFVLAAVLATAAPVAAQVETVTKPPSKYFASGAKVGILWDGFFGRVPRHVIIQNPSYTLDLIGASEGTLTVKCESSTAQKGYFSYNNRFTVNTQGTFIWYNGQPGQQGENRKCERIISVFARIEPGIEMSVEEAVTALQNPPGFPDFEPFRISVRGDTDFGELGE